MNFHFNLSYHVSKAAKERNVQPHYSPKSTFFSSSLEPNRNITRFYRKNSARNDLISTEFNSAINL